MRRAAYAGVVAAVAATAACGAARASGAVRTVEIVTHFSTFEPSTIQVDPGETVRFVIRNTDPIDHEFIVGDAQVQGVHERGTESHHDPRPGEVSVPAGETVATTYTFPAEGRLIFGCHLPGHYAFGMRGGFEIG